MSLLDTLIKCIIITEVAIIGSFLMFSYDVPIATGFILWGGVLAAIVFLCWYWGGLNIDEKNLGWNKSGAIFATTLLNGIMINLGGYFVLLLYLRFNMGFPISIGGM